MLKFGLEFICFTLISSSSCYFDTLIYVLVVWFVAHTLPLNMLQSPFVCLKKRRREMLLYNSDALIVIKRHGFLLRLDTV